MSNEDEAIVYNPVNTLGTRYDTVFFKTPTKIRMGEVVVAFQGQLTDGRVYRDCTLREAKQSTIVGTSPVTMERTTECPVLLYGPATVRFDRDLFPSFVDPVSGDTRTPLHVGQRLAITTHRDTRDSSKWGRWAPLPPDHATPWTGFPDDEWQLSALPIDEAWGRLAARHHHRRHYVPNMVPPPNTCTPANEYQLLDRVFAFVCEWANDPAFDISSAAQLAEVLRKILHDPLPAMVLRFDLTRYSRRPVTEPPRRRAVREEALVTGMILANRQINIVRDF